MAQAAKVQEPSMEEILASIRRIISDDDGTKSAKVTDSSAPVSDARPSAVAPIPSRPRQFPPGSTTMAPAPAPRPHAEEHHDFDGITTHDVPSTKILSESLLSNRSRTAIDNAFKSLASTANESNAPTLEDLVKDMLRPMLKSWLDDNLPEMVERMVRAEIERLSRGR